jgi:dolichol-phosphate mannosyltransferase
VRDLSIVIPVYNEADCIDDVLRDWIAVLETQGLDFELVVLNDGSRDATAEQLKAWQSSARVRVISKPNEGHGPTILRGYAEAVEAADWVFQVDGDNEVRASAFPAFWARRMEFDFLFGIRTDRVQSPARRAISAVSRQVVRLFGGRGVTDVNVPYRLMRAACLRPMLRLIPPDTFAPNVIIAGLAARSGCRILNLPVPHVRRRTGAGSLTRWRVWKAAMRSLGQTVRILRKHRDFRCAV